MGEKWNGRTVMSIEQSTVAEKEEIVLIRDQKWRLKSPSIFVDLTVLQYYNKNLICNLGGI